MSISTDIVVPGPLLIQYGATANFDLGMDKEGAVIRITRDWAMITSDKYGTTPIDAIYTGKTAIVEFQSIEFKKVLTASPWLADLGQVQSATEKIGELAIHQTTPRALQLKITQRDTKIWLAKYAILIGPSDHVLRSVQELRIPLTFQIFPDPDDADKLFGTVPSYT